MYIHSKNLSAIFISKVSLIFLQMITSGAGFCYCCKILCCNHAKYTAGFVIEPKDFGQQVIQVPYSPQQLQIHQYPNQNQNHQPYQEKSIQTGSSEVHAPYIKIIQWFFFNITWCLFHHSSLLKKFVLYYTHALKE